MTRRPVAATKPEYRLLVVAEKYQTGFDQPLLCAMYVDKPLTGVAAVQTLSRLNRILPPLKAQDDVRVLDFVNTAEDIQTSFEPWFETTITDPTDPNLLYAKQQRGHGVRGAGRTGDGGVHPGAGRGRARAADGAAERDLHARLHELPAAGDRPVRRPGGRRRSGRSSARNCGTTPGPMR